MIYTVIYIIEAKNRLVEWLKDSDPDLLECLKGPYAWTARESTSSDDLPDEKLAKFKVLFFLWLHRSYNLLTSLPPGSTLSFNTFDDFWTTRRIEVEGELADLRCGVDEYDFDALLPTNNPSVDAWVQEMKEKSHKIQA